MPLVHRVRNVLLVCLTVAGCTGEQDAPPQQVGAAGADTAAHPREEPSSPLQLVPPPSVEQDADFTTLTLADFTAFEADEGTWRERDGVIICSGEPKGYLHSRDRYGNYTWQVDYRFVPRAGDDERRRAASNTGFMLHIQEPHRIWPASLEVQGKWSEMASIKSNGGVPELTISDGADARERARRPVGEWNRVRIVVSNGAVQSILNGVPICTADAGELTEGEIGLQSEGFEVHFANLRIRRDEGSISESTTP